MKLRRRDDINKKSWSGLTGPSPLVHPLLMATSVKTTTLFCHVLRSLGWICCCWWMLGHVVAWAEDPAAGTPGGACLEDNTCQSGAECYNKPNGGTICLVPAENLGGIPGNPGTNNNQVLEQCPPQHRYLSCPPGGGNCQLRCVYPKGFGCSVVSVSGLWHGILLLALVWLLSLRLRYKNPG